MRLLQAIEVIFLGPTNTKNARVKMNDLRFKTSKIIPWDHTYTVSYEYANRYLTENGYHPISYAESGNGRYIIFIDDFQELK